MNCMYSNFLSKLLKKYNHNRTEENFNTYEKHRNKCVKWLREAKFDWCRNIDFANLTDNHVFENATIFRKAVLLCGFRGAYGVQHAEFCRILQEITR